MARAGVNCTRPEAGKIGELVSWFRPISYWDVVVYHFPLALFSGVALFLPCFVAIQSLPLIPCTFLRLTGIPCPFCGFTRSFWAIAHGRWSEAMYTCPLSFGVFFLVVILFLWNVSALAGRRVMYPSNFMTATPFRRRALAGGIFLLFLCNWIYRLTLGLT